MTRRTVLTALVAAALGGGIARAEIIDRILAVVDRAVITQSDVAGAIRLRLVRETSIAAALDRLIERRLVLAEVDRYAPPEPTDAQVDRRLTELRGASSPSEFDRAFVETGVSGERLRRHVRDDLRIDAYLQQRFGAPVQPSEDEVLQYYRDHAAQFSRAGAVRSYADANHDARSALTAERRAQTIAAWIAGLRRRADVNILPSVPSTPRVAPGVRE
jgi:hypothetical protein